VKKQTKKRTERIEGRREEKEKGRGKVGGKATLHRPHLQSPSIFLDSFYNFFTSYQHSVPFLSFLPSPFEMANKKSQQQQGGQQQQLQHAGIQKKKKQQQKINNKNKIENNNSSSKKQRRKGGKRGVQQESPSRVEGTHGGIQDGALVDFFASFFTPGTHPTAIRVFAYAIFALVAIYAYSLWKDPNNIHAWIQLLLSLFLAVTTTW
jgi:hypothetical protein